MAELRIDDESVTVVLSAAENLEALHGDLTVPRSAITAARVVPNGLSEVHGVRSPGTGIPGLVNRRP